MVGTPLKIWLDLYYNTFSLHGYNGRIAILAFHKALVEQPRDPLVVAAFSLAVSSGGSLLEAIEIARRISQPHETMFNEILEPVNTRSKNGFVDEVLDLAASVKCVLRKMTDREYVSQAMIRFSKAPRSDLVSLKTFWLNIQNNEPKRKKQIWPKTSLTNDFALS